MPRKNSNETFAQLNWNNYFEICGFTTKFVANAIGVSESEIRSFRKNKPAPYEITCRFYMLVKENLRAQRKFHQDQLTSVLTQYNILTLQDKDLNKNS